MTFTFSVTTDNDSTKDDETFFEVEFDAPTLAAAEIEFLRLYNERYHLLSSSLGLATLEDIAGEFQVDIRMGSFE